MKITAWINWKVVLVQLPHWVLVKPAEQLDLLVLTKVYLLKTYSVLQ